MTGHVHGRIRGGFVQHTLEGLHAAMDRALYAEHSAASGGLLQRLDPRVKVAGIFSFILVSASAGKLWVVAAILCAGIVLAALSRISLSLVLTRVWLVTLPFSATLALPAIFLTPGSALYRLPLINWTISAQGLRAASMLVLRAESAATLALILVFTTPWTHVLKALRMFRVPVVFVVILGMTCRYILLLLETAHEMFESRKSRTVGVLTRAAQRRIALLSSGALLSRTLHLSNEVYLAMQSRGFRGEVFILDDFRMKNPDWLASAIFGGVAIGLGWAGR
jgi:cobalt/nickel transport system permease protein